MHDFTSNFVGVIPEEMINEASLIASQCCLTDLTK